MCGGFTRQPQFTHEEISTRGDCMSCLSNRSKKFGPENSQIRPGPLEYFFLLGLTSYSCARSSA
jgi:hypothetical protein